jgi:plastocyanin
MKHVSLFAAATLAAMLAGCGGSGTVDNGPPPPAGNLRIEAVVMDPSGNLTNIIQDPRNFQANEDYTFQLVRYDDAGKREIVNGVRWRSSDDTGVYGALSANTGRFLSKGTESPTELTIQTSVDGKPIAAKYRILPRQVRFIGRVVEEGNPNKGVDGVTIEFFAPAQGRPTVEVNMPGMSYSPPVANVVAGDLVQWNNTDAIPHTVTRDVASPLTADFSSDTVFPDGIAPGQNYQWRVPNGAAPGTTIYYHCRFHGTAGNGNSAGTGMVGALQVVRDNTAIVKVGSVTTAFDGSFRASVPNSATRYQIVSSTLGNRYFNTVKAPGPDGTTYLRFDTESESCLPPMPANLPQIGQRDVSSTPLQLLPVKAGATKPDASAPCYY